MRRAESEGWAVLEALEARANLEELRGPQPVVKRTFLNDEEKSQLIAAGRFGSNSGEEVWNAVVDRIKARVGGYPEDWPRLVFLGELFV